jgi:putative DNA primase/helicase
MAEAYREEMDMVGHFLAECCAVGGTAKEGAAALWAAYRACASENGEVPLSRPEFVEGLKRHGFEVVRRRQGMVWKGVALRAA